jgi:hypothetical protein
MKCRYCGCGPYDTLSMTADGVCVDCDNAQGIEARSGETTEELARSEGRKPVPKDAPND